MAAAAIESERAAQGEDPTSEESPFSAFFLVLTLGRLAFLPFNGVITAPGL